MTAREYLRAVEQLPRGLDAYLRGNGALQERLLPGLRALCAVALANQATTSSEHARRLRAANASQLEIALEQHATFSVLRDILANQTWYELECRGDRYRPRGLVAVAHVWASWGLV